MRFLAGARNDMAIRWLWGAEVAIRVNYHLSKQFIFELPLLPPVLLKGIVIPSASEGSPSPITVLSKATFNEYSSSFIESVIYKML